MATLLWRDQARDLRNRLLTSTRFQQWAAAFPLTRPIARRRARKLFDLCAGFVYSQVLLACVRLRILEILAQQPQTALALSERLDLTADATERLLRAAMALELTEARPGGRYAPGPLGAVLLGTPGLTAMIEHHALLYADLTDPVGLLRDHARDSTELARHWAYASGEQPDGLSADRVDAYTDLMAATQPMIAAQVLDAYPFEKHGHRKLLDLGGGDGSFIAAVAAQTRQLELTLCDLPAVAARARVRFERDGLSERASAVGADMLKDDLPAGADIVTLVRILHDHDDSAALEILRAARRALPADGTLLIAEPLSGTRGAEPVGDAYFGFYLLAMGSGRPRTVGEITAMLQEAGFGDCRQLATRMPMLTSVLLARPTQV